MQEKKDVLWAVNLVTGSVILLRDSVKEMVMEMLSLQLQQHQQFAQLSRITHLLEVAVGARIGSMFFKISRIRNILHVVMVCYESLTLMFLH